MNLPQSRLARALRTLREDGTLRAVLKHTGWLTGSSGMIVVLSAVQGILTARMLGVAVWGALAVALTFSTVVGWLLSFRMNEFVVKWVSQLREEGAPQAATAFKLALVADVCSALVASVIIALLGGWAAAVFAKDPGFAWIFRSMALVVMFQAGQQSLIGMLQVDRAFRTQALVQTGAQAASVCGIAAAWLAGWGIRGVVVVLVGAAALTAVLMWTLGFRAARSAISRGWMRHKIVRFGAVGREMARFAILGNFTDTLSNVMTNGDVLVLGFLRNPVEVGYYKLAKSIAQIAYLPMMPLVNAAFPELSSAAARQSWGEFRALMRRGSKMIALWLIPVSAGMLLLVHPAVTTLYGKAFAPAALAFAVLLVGVNVDVVLFWTRASLLAMGEPGYPTAVMLWATAAQYALAFLVVPIGGYLAMAAVQSFVVVGMNALMARRTFTRLRIRKSVGDG